MNLTISIICIPRYFCVTHIWLYSTFKACTTHIVYLNNHIVYTQCDFSCQFPQHDNQYE